MELEKKPVDYEHDVVNFNGPLKIRTFLSKAEKFNIKINKFGGKGSHYKLETKDPLTSQTLIDILPVHSQGDVIGVANLKKLSKNLKFTKQMIDSFGGTVIRNEME